VSFAEAKGLRSQMEDRIVTQSFTIGADSWYILCVLDGHRGYMASNAIAERLTMFIRCCVTSHGSGDDLNISIPVESVPGALSKVFIALNKLLLPLTRSGSTMTVLIFMRKAGKLYGWSAHVGDSEAIQVSTSNRHTQVLTPKHRPLETDEKTRLEDNFSDMVILNNNMLLSSNKRMTSRVSRSIGDKKMGPAVTPEPEISVLSFTCTATHPDLFVIASDGLWDKVSPSTLGKMCLNTSTFLLRQKWRTYAEALCTWRNRQYIQHDNTSIIMALVYPIP
jgi:serine/threonine protein phosphatase PrpC